MENATAFSRMIDKRSRRNMESFLSGHFRYWTMNSWNRLSSYANCVKINRLPIPGELRNAAYEMLECSEVYDDLNVVIETFGEQHDWRWQIEWNGRSSGYLVLVRGERKPSEYKNVCDHCGQKNYEDAPERAIGADGLKCGRCGEMQRFHANMFSVVTHAASIDEGEDFSIWDIESLRERTKLVQDFDLTCDCVFATFLHFCRNFKVIEKVISVPKKVRVLEEVTQ